MEIRDGVATITLDRPETHNAFDDALIADLTAEVGSAGRAAIRSNAVFVFQGMDGLGYGNPELIIGIHIDFV